MTAPQDRTDGHWAGVDGYDLTSARIVDRSLAAILHAIAHEQASLPPQTFIAFGGSYQRDLRVGMDDGVALIRLTVLPGDRGTDHGYLVVLDADAQAFRLRQEPVFDIARFTDSYRPDQRDPEVLSAAPDTFAGRIIEPIRIRRAGGPLQREDDGSLSFGLSPD
jgi:hypothetical protein